jgi:hypothetical protein
MNFFDSEMDFVSHANMEHQSDSSSSSKFVDPLFGEETKEIVSRKRPITDISIAEDSPSKLLVWGITKLMESQEHANKRHEDMMRVLITNQDSFQSLNRKVDQLSELVASKGNAVVRQLKTSIESKELNDICTHTLLVLMKFGLDFHFNRNFVLPFKYESGDMYLVVAIFPLLVSTMLCVRCIILY